MSAPHPLQPTLRWFRVAVGTGLIGLVLLLGAMGVAFTRYASCGPSRFDAPELACRVGVHLLMAAYAVLGVALVLGAISLTLLWRVRRRIREARRRG